MEEKRKRGGQKGNQNARKHGFYSKVMDAAEKRNFTVANDIDGIDDEITVMRVKIRNMLAKDPENIKILMAAATILAGLLKARADLNKGQKKGFKESFGRMIKDTLIQVGSEAAGAVLSKKLG